MKTKFELLQAAHKSAVDSLSLTGTQLEPVDIEEHIKQEFAKLSVPKENFKFFREHYNGHRMQISNHLESPLEPAAQT